MTRPAARKPEKKPRPGVEQQRRDVIAAAVALFAVSGTAPVSVSAICAAAGVSRDTFYRCFDNKDALIDALYSQAVSDRMLAVTAAADANFTDRRWLRRTINDMVDAILDEHQVARFLFVEAADPGSHAHAVITGAFDRASRSMQRWCRREYGQAPSRDCFNGLLWAAQWLVQSAIDKGMDAKNVRRAKRAIEELFLATFRGLRP